LLWSHYADSFQGVCLAFDPISFENALKMEGFQSLTHHHEMVFHLIFTMFTGECSLALRQLIMRRRPTILTGKQWSGFFNPQVSRLAIRAGVEDDL
jgi:hypothetical protein